MKVLKLTALLVLFVVFLNMGLGRTVAAAPVTGFSPGRIIDDGVFTNINSMNTAQTQAFLSSKVPACDTNGTGVYPGYQDYPGETAAQWGTSHGVPPPYICLKNYTENGLSAAQIIYNTAKQYQINPQVLIVLLQKEQGLVTDTWPLPSQYRTATGYGCPDSTPGVCDASYYGLTAQLTWSATMFKTIVTNSQTWSNPYGSGTVWYTPYLLGDNYIQWNPNSACGGSTVNIQNRSTQALYNYTPYQPNQASLNAGYGLGDSCSSYGNRNFFEYFTDWFGSTYAYIHNGISYTDVFDAQYYLNKYPDVLAVYGSNPLDAFKHFVNYGMSEGRQGNASFDVNSYRNRYQDLRIAFGTNLTDYYIHYITNGKVEGRIATGNVAIQYITSYNGIDYSSVYNFATYTANYTDMQQNYSNDDAGAIRHFVTEGMVEGRQASNEFNVTSYEALYYDLRRVFGSNLKAYYMQYITNGKAEGRTGVSNYIGGISSANDIDYSSVYNFNGYTTNNADVRNIFGLDDIASLQHFINYGMSEGRGASSEFNVFTYKNRYPDLQSAFGNNLKTYFLHYITNGKAEGRIAN